MRARRFHLVAAVVTLAALVLQLWLALDGHRTLVTEGEPSTRVTMVRFLSYFTILSNILVAWTTATLASGKDRNTRVWRVLRLDAVVAIAVTGIVHWFFLRPLLDLHGYDALADRLLHVVVPILAVLGWVLYGPRGRIRREDLLPSALFPAAYMVWTLVHGAATHWYPYPFCDVDALGYGRVVLNGLGVVALIVVIAAGAWKVDSRLPGRRRWLPHWLT